MENNVEMMGNEKFNLTNKNVPFFGFSNQKFMKLSLSEEVFKKI